MKELVFMCISYAQFFFVVVEAKILTAKGYLMIQQFSLMLL